MGYIMKAILAILVASICLLAGPCEASTLVDYGGYTVDTNSGLQWLDVSTTFHRSYNDVSANLTNTGDAVYGYRYATLDDLKTLASDAGLTSSLPCNPCGPSSALENLVNLLGPYTAGTAQYAEGYTADAASSTQQWGADFYYDAANNVFKAVPHNFAYTKTTVANNLGSFLVKSAVPTTPLPSGLPLFVSGLGAMGLFGCFRKRKKVAATAV